MGRGRGVLTSIHIKDGSYDGLSLFEGERRFREERLEKGLLFDTETGSHCRACVGVCLSLMGLCDVGCR